VETTKNVEHIPTSHSLEKSASLRVEGEFLLLYNKPKTCGKLKKRLISIWWMI